MQTYIQALSEEERHRVHEDSLKILAETGVRMETPRGRKIMHEAGAQVDENNNLVRFPRGLVEQALHLTPKNFILGARRPDWDLEMNSGECSLVADGEALSVIDRHTGERRNVTFQDWLEATRLIDALDELGVFWSMVRRGKPDRSAGDMVRYLCDIFRNFSKHVQDSLGETWAAPWLTEILQVIFGDKDTVRKRHPFSYLLCPQSPLIIDEYYTEAYLELLGWDIPVAIMPMPLMGGTSPGSLISTVVQGNCEVLATLCLVQAAEPGAPVIYAPVLATMNPRTGQYSGGAIELGLMSVAAIQMARYYGLPVEASGGGTDQFIPGIQAAYERAMNALLPTLAWPDILVGPGLLGGSMILSLEQLVIDVEMFRMSVRAHEGINGYEERWLTDVIREAGPGSSFIGERSTLEGIRGGEWYISDLGVHEPIGYWEQAGMPSLLDQAKERVDEILATHKPLPLDEHVEKELLRIEAKARESSGEKTLA
jgi:trimethylamine--corrinoid protein Co-methyltransferase